MRVLILGDVDLVWAEVVGKGRKWVGEKILPGEGRKSLCPNCSYLPCPLACCTSTNPSKSVESQTQQPPFHAFPLPGMLFCPLHFSLCPTPLARRKERSQKKPKPNTTLYLSLEGSAMEGSGEKFSERVAGSAKC